MSATKTAQTSTTSATSTTKTVQMRFSATTVERVNELATLIGIDNRTQIVAQAIAMYYEIESAQKNGGTLYIEYPDKRRERLIIVGR